MKVKVYRDSWSRGTYSKLLDEKGKMCCLGFVCKTLGVTDEEMLDVIAPDCIADTGKVGPLIEGEHEDEIVNTEWVTDAVDINDADDIDDTEREADLLRLCERADAPVQFEFVDGSEEVV